MRFITSIYCPNQTLIWFICSQILFIGFNAPSLLLISPGPDSLNTLFPWKLYKINLAVKKQLFQPSKIVVKLNSIQEHRWCLFFQNNQENVIGHMFWCLQPLIWVSLLFLSSLKLAHYYKLNWPKKVTVIYWLLGTLLYILYPYGTEGSNLTF